MCQWFCQYVHAVCCKLLFFSTLVFCAIAMLDPFCMNKAVSCIQETKEYFCSAHSHEGAQPFLHKKKIAMFIHMCFLG